MPNLVGIKIFSYSSLSVSYIEKKKNWRELTLLPGGPGRPRPPGKPAVPCEMSMNQLVQD